MQRLWSAILTSILTAGPVLGQSIQPAPRPIMPAGPVAYPPTYAIPSPTTAPTPADLHSPDGTCNGALGGTCNTGRGGCDCDGPCGPPGRVFGEFDYILWQARGDTVPALLTTSPAGTPQALAGVLGAPGTTTLFGGNGLNDIYRSGFKGTVGAWLNPQQTFGIQASALWLGNADDSISLSSGGVPILARPFFNAVAGAPASVLIAFPGVVAGNFNATERTSFSAFDVALRGNFCCGPQWRFDALLGYRRIQLSDRLRINNAMTAGAGAPGALGVPAGTTFNITDAFSSDNVFNGVEVGFLGEYRFLSGLFVSGGLKAAYGYLDQKTDIRGGTVLTVPGAAPITSVGGLLALQSNIGNFPRSEGQLIPELNLNIGYQFTDNLRVRAGWTFLYMDNVIRPGKVIDTSINPNLIPPTAGAAVPLRPVFNGDRNDFYLQGLNAGVELRF
jgi:hypothetical protein